MIDIAALGHNPSIEHSSSNEIISVHVQPNSASFVSSKLLPAWLIWSRSTSSKIPCRHNHHHHNPPTMPRRLPIRPPRPSRSPSHPSLPPDLRKHGRSLIRRPHNPVEFTPQSKRPPKIVALDAVARPPLPRTSTDFARRQARIEQIKQLYTPREFKRLRDQQMQLVLPENPLKTTKGRIRVSVLMWLYVSILVWSQTINGNGRFLVCSIRSIYIRRSSRRGCRGIFGRTGGSGCPRGCCMIRRTMILIREPLRSLWMMIREWIIKLRFELDTGSIANKRNFQKRI